LSIVEERHGEIGMLALYFIERTIGRKTRFFNTQLQQPAHLVMTTEAAIDENGLGALHFPHAFGVASREFKCFFT
jgi:hypothetical protein